MHKIMVEIITLIFMIIIIRKGFYFLTEELLL